MAYPSFLQPFGAMPNPMPYDPLALGLGGFPYQPWPPGVDPALASPIALAAAGVGNWLAGIVPPFVNALMTPAFGSFPSLMQTAWPQPAMDPKTSQDAIAFASLLSQQRVTDLIAAEGQVPAPVLTQLRHPGQSVQWSVPGPDGQLVTAKLHRLAPPTDDCGWVLQADVYEGDQRKSSQQVRVYDIRANRARPTDFREAVARIWGPINQRASEGDDVRVGVACTDGLGLSTATTVVSQQVNRQREARRELTEGGGGTFIPRGGHAQEDADYERFFRQMLGPNFPRDLESLLKDLPLPTPARGHEGSRRPMLSRATSDSNMSDADYDSGYESDGEFTAADKDEDYLPRLLRLRSADPRPTMSESGTQTEGVLKDSAAPAPAPAPARPPAAAHPPASATGVVTPAQAPAASALAALQEQPPPADLQPPLVPMPMPMVPEKALPPVSSSRRDPPARGVRSQREIEKQRAELSRGIDVLSKAASDFRVKHLPDVPAGDPGAEPDRKGLGRSSSVPDLRAATPALTRALGKARSESDLQTLGQPTKPGLVTREMTELFRAIDLFSTPRSRIKRAFGLAASDPLGDMMEKRIAPLIDRIREKVPPNAPKRPDAYVLEALSKAAQNAFGALPSDQQSRLRKAFADNHDVLRAVHKSRDRALTFMSAPDGDVTSAAFRSAARRQAALTYTIAALEQASKARV